MKTKINRRDHLKTLKCILLFALIPASLASAGTPILIPNLCGTGRNPACTGLQPIGSVDAHWRLAFPYPSSASGQPLPLPPPLLTYGPAYVNAPNGNWLPNGPDTQWIMPLVTLSLGGNYVYETTFDIPSGYDPATATISGWWSSDNDGVAVWLNDTQLTGFPLPGGSGFNAMTNFTITHGVAGATFRCSNRLFFVLRNRGAGGFDTNPTDTGLRVQFTQSSVLPLPLPTLGNYPNTTLLLSGDTTVTPDATPSNTTSINVSTSTNFNGLLEADPATGVVRVTNAHPAGIYTVTVTAFNGCATTMRTFTLTVTTPPACGQITFAPKKNYAVGQRPRAVVIGDFNRDGRQDVAVANLNSASVSVLLGKITGGFGPAVNFSTVGVPASVAVGDFNGDGKQDLATGDENTDAVSVLLGDGMGSFGTATSFPANEQPSSVEVGDFNDDARQDLVVTNLPLDTVSVLLGNGGGGFGPATSFPAGQFPFAVAIGNFNGGKQDLAVARSSSGSSFVSVLLGSGLAGTLAFSVPQSFPLQGAAGTISVAVGNFDSNSNMNQDLATANQLSANVSVLLGDGAGSFPLITNFPTGMSTISAPQSVAVGDFNGDGRQDLTTANFSDGNASVLLGDGNGNFGAPSNFGVGGGPDSVAVGDFNGDGRQDLAVANSSSDNVSILLRQCPCAPIFSQNFDGVMPPNLPTGWTATNAPGSPPPPWVTSSQSPDTAVGFNNAFVDDPAVPSDKSLTTPSIAISSASAQLSFRNFYNLENGYDGGVLEVSISGGPFTDIISAGGSFITGGYNAEISGAFGNPIAGRMAWSGNSCCYICTVVNLPAALNGQTVMFRFRMGSDSSVAGAGWRIDKVQVSDGNGSVCCATGPVPTILASVSTRALVGPGDNAGIGGFIIMGSEPKPVLLRAIGPSLTQFGVPNALGDPVLELHGPVGFVTITNNNWRDTQEAEIQATGIPPTNDLESAIVATLAPGAYTAVLAGNGNTSGVALVEVYDLDQAARSTLANISTRAFVGAADNILIVGVVVARGDLDRLVFRGIGPSLTALGVPNALANPTLELRDSNGALLVANNNWQDDPAQAAELTAAGLAPANNLESGIFATLPPGAYTALLAGLNNGTGVGLVEVYDLDAVDSTTNSPTACLSQ